MPRHDHYEQMTLLALVGELSPDEHAELAGHLVHCSACRAARDCFSTLANDVLPVGDRKLRQNCKDESLVLERLRPQLIGAVRQQGLMVSDEAARGTDSWLGLGLFHLRLSSWRLLDAAPRLALAVMLIGVVVGTAMFSRRLTEARARIAQLEAADVSARQAQAVQLEVHRNLMMASGEIAANRLAQAQAQIDAARDRETTLSREVASDRDSIGRLELEVVRLRSEAAKSSSKATAVTSSLLSAQQELERFRARASEAEAQMVAQQFELKDMTAQIDAVKLGAERERLLTASGREIRELMGARDLHMIDVHDIDRRGNWKQPYGRIFLTDNRELVFYAFDLHAIGGRGKSFHVWGQRLDDASTTVSLGNFRLDDPKQARWLMKLNDARLIGAIDSVFVTVEGSDGPRKPSGKTLMYAYLRNPINHP